MVCRAFRKQNPPTQRQSFGGWSHGGIRLLTTAEITRHGHLLHTFGGGGAAAAAGGDLHDQEDLELKLPHLGNLLESPPPSACLSEQFLPPEIASGEDALVDWKVLDKLLASQITQPSPFSSYSFSSIPFNFDPDEETHQDL